MTWIFWFAAALIAYTYVGYIAWLWLQAQLFPWPVLRSGQEHHISVVMVVRNEEGVLEDKLQNLLNLDYPAEKCRIIVVSDGSTDKTEGILNKYSEHPRVEVTLNPLPRGKACGLNDACERARGEIVVFTDARQKIEGSALRLLMENFADSQVGCVSGELMLGDPAAGESSRGMGLYWRIEKRVRELEAASGSVVGATGALYAVRRELLEALPAGAILDDVYIPLQVARKGSRVLFDPRARAWDSPSLGDKLEFSRKVRTLSGNYQLLQAAPWLLSGKNPIRFRFVSHKLLRLAVPFALAVVLAGSIVLSGIVYRIALLLQLLLYALSLVAVLRLNKGPLARVADASLTFVLLNTAALVAFANFVTGRKTAWSR
ncbi:MAG TPA: glycosyltransferase family 2 protein [Candidatus Sulfotelmatobacter sp.]|jgi:cellulose synthase/poly-beta-1,6-N-acetylglucosamine synthase-like glycosyltransferase